MKSVGITICGHRYNVNLEDTFAEFVEKDLALAGVKTTADNDPKDLLKAYLRLAKQIRSYEKEIELLAETLESL